MVSSTNSSDTTSCNIGCALVRDDHTGSDPLETVSSNSQRSQDQVTVVLSQNLNPVAESTPPATGGMPQSYSPARAQSSTRRPSPAPFSSHRGGEPNGPSGRNSSTTGASSSIPTLNLLAIASSQNDGRPQTASGASSAMRRNVSAHPQAQRGREGSSGTTLARATAGNTALELARTAVRPSSAPRPHRVVTGGIVEEPQENLELHRSQKQPDSGPCGPARHPGAG